MTLSHDRRAEAIRWLALALADGLFLWMYLSAAPIDALGEATVAAGKLRLGHSILVFAADWRHGMNGHSPIYMPGFFALTMAAWYWTRSQSVVGLVVGGLVALVAGLAVAWVAMPAGRTSAVAAFASEFHLPLGAAVSSTWQVVSVSAYTAACWTVLIVGSRKAITTRSLRPLAVTPVLYGVLAFTRRWSFEHLQSGDDIARWGKRLSEGDSVAIVSLLAIPLGALILLTATSRELAREKEVPLVM